MTANSSASLACARKRSLFRSISKLVAASSAHLLFVPGLLIGMPVSAATWPVYDVNAGMRGNANRQIFQGFFDSSANSQFITDMHEGLDILADGQGGQEVAAARAGTLIENSNAAGGTIAIRVNVGTALNPVYETDSYNHVTADAALPALGAAIGEGIKLGNVSTTAFGAGSRHLHFDVQTGVRTTNGGVVAGITTQAASPTAMLNPYLRFTAAADIDPGQANPALIDTNNDNRTILLVTQGNTNPAGGAFAVLTKAVSGNIDIIADARDPQHSTLNTGAGPHKIGYSVKALFDQEILLGEVPRHDVKSAAAPYLLAKFDDNWAATAPAANVLYADSGTNANTAAQVVSELRVSNNTTIFPESKHYIVTNTTGGTGAPGNASAAQYWRTNAKDDFSADTADTANGVGMTTTALNAEARFRDGDYGIRVHLSDVVAAHDVAPMPGKVRLDNFTQTAVPGANNGAAPPPAFLIGPLSGSNLPFLPGHGLDPETAPLIDTFRLGDTITASGDQYYGSLLMDAFVFTHQASWTDGALFPAPGNPAFVAAQFVQADAFGSLGPTNMWTASKRGNFDLIIDYDRDGKFSATLDGLGGFAIVPEPTTMLLLVIGLTATAWRGCGMLHS